MATITADREAYSRVSILLAKLEGWPEMPDSSLASRGSTLAWIAGGSAAAGARHNLLVPAVRCGR